MESLSEEEIAQAREVFDQFDANKNGACVIAVRPRFDIFRRCTPRGNIAPFAFARTPNETVPLHPTQLLRCGDLQPRRNRNMQRTHILFAVHFRMSCVGKIDSKELKAALHQMGRTPSEVDIEKMMRDADTDNSGELDFKEVDTAQHCNRQFVLVIYAKHISKEGTSGTEVDFVFAES